MSGNNMESLLMGDDSSSGESDGEDNEPVTTGTTAASAISAAPPNVLAKPEAAATDPTQAESQILASVTASAPAPSPKPEAISEPAPKPSNSKAEQMARLKNLYSISKSGATNNQSGETQSASTAPKITQSSQHSQQPKPTHHQQSPGAVAQQNMQQQPYQQHTQPQRSNNSQHSSRSHSQQRQPQIQGRQFNQSMPQSSQYSQQQRHQGLHQRQSSQSSQQHRRHHHHLQQSQQPLHGQQQMPRQHIPRRGNVNQPHNVPSRSQQHQAVVDPFAPTPLSEIKAQSGQSSSSSRRPHQYPNSGSISNTSSRDRQIKKEKEKFLMFTRVLIKYLEQKDKNLHNRAKLIIKDCAERNKRQEPGFESVTESMKRRLRELVGDHYWKKANDYLHHFIEQKKKQHSSSSMGGNHASRSGSSSMSSSAHHHQQFKQQQQQQSIERKKREEQKRLQQQQFLEQQKQQQQQQLQQQQLQQQQLQQQQLQQQQIKLEQQNVTAVPQQHADNRPEIHVKKEPIGKAASTGAKSKSKSASRALPGSATNVGTAVAPAPGPANKMKGVPKKAARRSSSTTPGNRQSNPKTTLLPPKIVEEPPPREYRELMDCVDHVVDYDWTSIGQLFGVKNGSKLSDEDYCLLYGDMPETTSTSKKKAAKRQSIRKLSDSKKSCVKLGIRSGWGRSNVLSVRAAWARVRLNESQLRKKSASQPFPIVADGLLTLPVTQADSSTLNEPTNKEYSWINEETAEQDETLALLSEGCQIYLKGILQKTIQCARQRQNLSGLRLWHQQFNEPKGKGENKLKKPPLSLRLGCDVRRQFAQAQGNSAMIVKRMEEALSRQTGIPMQARELSDATLQEATSMDDLSWRPLLKEAAEKADYHAKRSFEIYGGKEAKKPPFGNVPKKPRLQVEDLIMGSMLSIDGPYHKTFTASSFISF